MNDLALELDSYGIAFGDRVILSSVTLDLPRRGMTVLVGPAGGGKSTLLRTLAGLNAAHPALSTWGTARMNGTSVLVMQHARFFLDTLRENLVSALPNRGSLSPIDQTRLVRERLVACGLREVVGVLDGSAVDLSLAFQRRLAIARALVSNPSLLFVDEPTAGLDDHDAIDLIAMLRAEARERAVLLVTHNQRLARCAGGRTVLLAGGRVHERAETRAFFDEPGTDAGRAFVRTGGCNLPSPESEAPVEPRSRFVGPRGFFWLLPGRLGGLPRPGIVDELAHDVAGLARLGVTTLVTLEETQTVDPGALATARIQNVHFPIVDMSVPRVDDAIAFCTRVARSINEGEVVAFHCRAGLGRTGTMLAAQLVHAGRTPVDAIDAVRAINPRCIQSDEQIAFIRRFEIALRGAAAPEIENDIRRRGDNTWH